MLTATEAGSNTKTSVLTATEAGSNTKTAVLTATESSLEYVLRLPSASADGKQRPPRVAGTLVPDKNQGG